MVGTLLGTLASNTRWVVVGGLLTFLLLGAVWIAAGNEEAAAGQDRQTADQGTTASPFAASSSAASPSASLDPAFDTLESILDDASASASAEEETGGIPGLGAVEVTGNLEHAVADGVFPCDGPSPDGDLVLWSCAHPSGGYAAEVVGHDPLTVFSVTASTRGLPEQDAEAFFGYVLARAWRRRQPWTRRRGCLAASPREGRHSQTASRCPSTARIRRGR